MRARDCCVLCVECSGDDSRAPYCAPRGLRARGWGGTEATMAAAAAAAEAEEPRTVTLGDTGTMKAFLDDTLIAVRAPLCRTRHTTMAVQTTALASGSSRLRSCRPRGARTSLLTITPSAVPSLTFLPI